MRKQSNTGSTQSDEDAQIPGVTQTHERKKAESQQSSPTHPQTCAYDRVGRDDDISA
jgi:hypothetical protein